ncbi:Retrovirus-related Pol polyprotein from transposon 297 [Frankliniella fusca]|uniref:Retrovirus-related Pol polyprotein from transposon 297 n=1 Tax=Frankliniella fusca TaxID=407009 RepID=A0AAE1GTJ9_9NEOP|nr:Retrovirus-related Pol polyprotein from transposon 297 [Frankliniella fusca]
MIKGRKLTWSAFHKECIALYESIKYFENELRLVNKFTVVTDCTSLKYLLTMEAPKTPFDKFISYLSNFTFDFEFVPSLQNKVPDSLSRLLVPQNSTAAVKIPASLVTPLHQINTTSENDNTRIKPKESRNTHRISTQTMPVLNLLEGLNAQNLNYEQTDISPIHGFIGESSLPSSLTSILHPSPTRVHCTQQWNMLVGQISRNPTRLGRSKIDGYVRPTPQIVYTGQSTRGKTFADRAQRNHRE